MARRLALLLSIAAGCGGPSVTAPPPAPKPVAKVEAPKPVARWHLGRSSTFPVGRALRFGPVSLVPGAHGERWITRENGSIVNAPTLLDGDLVAALRGPGGIDLVTATGDVLTVATPEGEVLATTRAPKPFVRAAADDAAILAVGPKGTLERSTDRGKTWLAVDVARFGRAFDVAMDRSGRALALLVPEGAIGSVDHGATWTRLPSPVPAPERVSIADDGLVYVGSPESGARWDGVKFLPPEKVEADRRWIDQPSDGPIVASAMGEHALLDVVLVGEKVRYAVTPIGGVRTWRSIDDHCRRVDASAHGQVFSFSCQLTPSEKNAIKGTSARDFLSVDGGATFTAGAERPGYDEKGMLRYAIGPHGAALAMVGLNQWSIRPASDRPFRALGLVPELLAATVDEKRGRFVVLLVDEYSKLLFGAIPFDGGEPTLFGTPTSIGYRPEHEPAAIAIDGDTIVATVAGEKEIAVLRGKDGGATIERTDLPLARATVSLSRDRGLIASGGRLYETYDFVAKSRDVGASSAGTLACDSAGCGVGFAMRIGWDHPNRPEVAIAPKPVSPPDPPKSVPRDIDCTIGAKTGPLVGTFDVREAYDIDAGLRWFGEHELVEGTEDKPAAKVTTLLAKGSTKEQIIFHALPNGVVAVRYSIPPKGGTSGLRPVNMQIAWRRTGDPKVRTAKLGEVGTFRIAVNRTALAERRWPWIVGIVDGGVVVQPTWPKAYRPATGHAEPYTERDPIRYVHDDGKIELLAAPEPIEIARVLKKTDGGWMLVTREPADDGTVSVDTMTDGKTWKHRSIRLWTPATGAESGFWFSDGGGYEKTVGFGFTFTNGAPTWSIASNDSAYAYLATLTPSGLAMDGAKIVDDSCGDEAGTVRIPYPLSGGALRLGEMLLDHAVLRFSRNGTACMRAVGGENNDGDRFVVSLASSSHAWIVKNPVKGELHTMKCTIR